MSPFSYDQFFPFMKIRDEQRTAIEFALNTFSSGKRFVVCEMGTGTGKSATGVTVARYMAANPHQFPSHPDSQKSGAYVLTTQKILQEQYIKDFGPASTLGVLRSIKSSTNYTCSFYSDQSCGESRRILSKFAKNLASTEFFKCCKTNCQYSVDKQEFIDSQLSITNFSYFLAETMYVGKLEPRQLLVIDECHNIESELGKFVELTFSERFARDVLKCKLPTLSGDEEKRMKQVGEWAANVYKPALEKHIKGVEKALRNCINIGASFKDLGRQHDLLDKHICKVNRFAGVIGTNTDDWIMNVIEPQTKRAGRKFEFKPLDVSSYSHDALYRFGGNVLMMSATIVDKDVFCRSIGIDPNDVAFISIPSPFSVENRPIHYLRVGKMSMKNIDSTLPKMAEVVGMIIDKHANDKGIIHCTSFKVAQYIRDHVKSKRLLIHDSDNRDAVLNEHVTCKAPTVLLSPSMMEGVDLADDASRFQIICKIPFPYLGDQVVRKRKNRNPRWYSFQTAKSVIQSLGRSIRNVDDHAVSYILDEDWEYFYERNKEMFPSDFSRQLSIP